MKNLPEFNLALCTKTVIIPVKVEDSAGNKTILSTEFKTYSIEETKERYKEYSSLFTSDVSLMSEEEVEHLDKQIMDFIRKEIISFRTLKLFEPTTNKVLHTIANTSDSSAQDVLKYFDSGELCTSYFFNKFMSYSHYKEALRNSLFAALKNTKIEE